jgi:hypothetical protein
MGEAGDIKIIRLGYLIAGYQNPNSAVIATPEHTCRAVEEDKESGPFAHLSERSLVRGLP